MRVKTRAGAFIIVKEESVIDQEMRVNRNETYYVLSLADGRKVHLAQAADKIPVARVIDTRVVKDK